MHAIGALVRANRKWCEKPNSAEFDPICDIGRRLKQLLMHAV